MYLPVFSNSPEILSQALSRMFWLRYSYLDLFQRHGYFLTSSISWSKDITQNIYNTQLNSDVFVNWRNKQQFYELPLRVAAWGLLPMPVLRDL